MTTNKPIDRKVYVIECAKADGTNEVITASRDKAKARDTGELAAEFNVEDTFYLNEYTLQ